MDDAPQRAKPVVAWAIVDRNGDLTTICFPYDPTNRSLFYRGERIARVRIEEISNDEA